MNQHTPDRPHDTTFEIVLPYPSPPLSENKRMHWAAEAEIKRDVRQYVWAMCRKANLRRPAEHVSAQLNWRPARKTRADADNPTPTMKVVVDALAPQRDAYRDRRGKLHPGVVGYGLIVDDVPEYCSRPETIFHPKVDGQPARLWVELLIWYPQENA